MMSAGDVGIVWRMDPSKTLDMNIFDGIKAHYKRTGMPAEVVDVHPDDFKHHLVEVPGVEVRADVGTLKGEVFVGRRAKKVLAESAKENHSHAEPQPLSQEQLGGAKTARSQRKAFVERANHVQQ